MQDLHSTSYLPRADARSPSGRRQPVPDRTLGAQGQRPGGAINPHARKGVSTFGNTGKHRPGPGPDPDCAERRLNPQAPKGLVHKKSAPRVGFLSYADSGQPHRHWRPVKLKLETLPLTLCPHSWYDVGNRFPKGGIHLEKTNRCGHRRHPSG